MYFGHEYPLQLAAFTSQPPQTGVDTCRSIANVALELESFHFIEDANQSGGRSSSPLLRKVTGEDNSCPALTDTLEVPPLTDKQLGLAFSVILAYF